MSSISEARRTEDSFPTRKTLTTALRWGGGGFRREVQPRRQHWFLNEKSGFPFRTPAFCSVSRGQRRLGEKEDRARSVTQRLALRVGIQGLPHDFVYDMRKGLQLPVNCTISSGSNSLISATTFPNSPSRVARSRRCSSRQDRGAQSTGASYGRRRTGLRRARQARAGCVGVLRQGRLDGLEGRDGNEIVTTHGT